MSVDRFVPAPLPRWERLLCWAVWIFHSAAAFYIAFRVSRGHLRPWIQNWLTESSYLSGYEVDLSDNEWEHFRNTVSHMILDYSLHSIMYFLVIRFVETKWTKIILISGALLLQIHLTSLTCVSILFAFTVIVTSLSIVTRNIAVPWILCISFVLKASDYLPFTMDGIYHLYYCEFNVYLYGAIKILNFSLYMCQNKDIKYKDIWQDHLLYLTYLPYSMTLIVLFEDFLAQLQRRLASSDCYNNLVNLRWTAYFGARLIFWFFVFEFILHFIHVHSIFNSPFAVIHRLGPYETCVVAYVIGQLFHLKYVVLFGTPAFFAYLDGMQPPPPPICISRVSRYSRMWRHFDVGLYRFLRNQVYIPLLKPQLPTTLAILRSLGTLVAVFGVVLAWHGIRTHYICWVSLSALELIMEKIGRYIWRTDSFQNLRNVIGDLNTRRMIAVAMIATVIPGIFGVFFFLGTEGIGSTIFNKLIIHGLSDIFSLNIYPSDIGFTMVHMIILGYFFNNVCLELDAPATRIKEAKQIL